MKRRRGYRLLPALLAPAAGALLAGDYARQGDALTFQGDGPGGASFAGEVDGQFIDLALPPAVGVAPLALDLHLGPRQPF